MKCCESVIVTVTLPREGSALDLELPAFTPARELGGKILETLRAMAPGRYESILSLGLRHEGRMLGDAETLALAGIWDGGRLELISGGEV